MKALALVFVLAFAGFAQSKPADERRIEEIRRQSEALLKEQKRESEKDKRAAENIKKAAAERAKNSKEGRGRHKAAEEKKK